MGQITFTPIRQPEDNAPAPITFKPIAPAQEISHKVEIPQSHGFSTPPPLHMPDANKALKSGIGKALDFATTSLTGIHEPSMEDWQKDPKRAAWRSGVAGMTTPIGILGEVAGGVGILAKRAGLFRKAAEEVSHEIPIINKVYGPEDYASDNAFTRAHGLEVSPEMENLAKPNPLKSNKLRIKLNTDGTYTNLDTGEVTTIKKPTTRTITFSRTGELPPQTLPRDLQGAKPRYNIRDKSYSPKFESDIDKAAYITAQTNPSPRDKDYLKFVMDTTGLDETGARNLGKEVKGKLKDTLKLHIQNGGTEGDVPFATHWKTSDTSVRPTSSNMPNVTRPLAETPHKVSLPDSEGRFGEPPNIPPENQISMGFGKEPPGPPKTPKTNVLEYARQASDRMKNLFLGGGIPYRPLNIHGYNIARAETDALGIKGAVDFAKGAINPKYDLATLKRLEPLIEKAQKFGYKTNAEELVDNQLTNLLNKSRPGRILNKGQKFVEKVFEDPLFKVKLPAAKATVLEHNYNRLLKAGKPEEEALAKASEMSNLFLGGIDKTGRSRIADNLLHIIFLAPDWAESRIRLAVKQYASLIGKSDPEYAKSFARSISRRILTGVASSALAGIGVKKLTSTPSSSSDLQAGETEGKKARELSTYGTAAEGLRLPENIIQGLRQGSIEPLIDIAKNRINLPIQSGINLLKNSDSLDNKIYNYPNQTRQKLSPTKQATNILIQIGAPVSPQLVTALASYISGNQGAEESISQALELPITYRKPTNNGEKSGLFSIKMPKVKLPKVKF